MTLTGANGATLGATPTHTVTIVDDDPAPAMAIGDVTVTEAAGAATFTVTLSAASGQLVSVTYATANGTAVAGSDYTATGGVLTFDAGVVSQPIVVPIVTDTVPEPTETFVVTLSSPASCLGANSADEENADGARAPAVPVTSPAGGCCRGAAVTG